MGEIVAGIGGVALFIFLFFDWFSGAAELTGTPGNLSLSEPGISGWNALTDLPGFLIMLAGASGIALACLAATGRRLNVPVRRGAVTALLGTLAVLLILWRMVAGTPTLKVGIFLGLTAAVAITVGALLALTEDGWEPLAAVAGGRAATAAASAPPATPPPPAEAPTATQATTSRGSRGRQSTGAGSRGRRSTGKRTTTTRRTSSRSTGTRSASRSGTKRSSGSRSTTSRSKSSGSRSTSSRSSSSRSGSSRRSSARKQ